MDNRPSAELIRAILKKCNSESVLSGKTENLCIVRVDPQQDWTLENAIVITTEESDALTAMRKLVGTEHVKLIQINK